MSKEELSKMLGEILEKYDKLPFDEKLETLEKFSMKLQEYLGEVTKLGEPELYKFTCEMLKEKGYKVFEQPWESYGTPDIIAMKIENETPTECLIVEVKGVDNPYAEQLRRYNIGEISKIEPTIKKKKFILILPVWDGEDFEVWGIKQIKPDILKKE
ncbi:MAG: hypothetical protein QXN95_00785 [Candidatus Bathyarchaeia archaeon]